MNIFLRFILSLTSGSGSHSGHSDHPSSRALSVKADRDSVAAKQSVAVALTGRDPMRRCHVDHEWQGNIMHD